MIEPQRSIVIDQVVVSFDIVVSFVEAVEGVRSLAWGDVEVIVASVMVRGGASSPSVALRPSLSSSTSLVTGTCMWGWGGWRGLSYSLIALAAAAVAFSLDLGSDGWDEGGGEIGVSEFGGFDDGRVGEEGGRGGEVSKSLDGIIEVAFLGPL
jgi:hypothetical protein